ncbi:RUS1 family protein-like protein 2 [Colletotrichum chlorophyti]|uniref:RUS1 family protein-like protein 2 n=1 Tax=Colletotrichum chlorophyti TaxID=708187 RepID=A0A1Q8RC67_9PEZI|nr:RUS1 family protein-like protein 2 [Colletotrichum chlorophyti]
MKSDRPQDLLIEERDGSGKVTRRWFHSGVTNKLADVRDPHADRRPNPLTTSVINMRQVILDAFLPTGYPDSVTPDYIGYQTFDSLQAFFSTITGLLANRAILQGLGVGDANSSATYALLLTILKDGISRVATIAFAYRFGLVIEPECKRYRLLADIFNDSAFFLDLFSPYFDPVTKVAALVLAEALRAMCGVAAGASKAALSKHFARRNNLSELNAKEASQETAVGLVGLLAGSVVVRYVESREAVFALMVALVFVHLGMNYLGVRCVQLNVLNQQRATILFQHYVDSSKKQVLTPAQVAARESVIVWRPVLKNDLTQAPAEIRFARSYADAVAPDVKGARPELVAFKHRDAAVAGGFVLCVSRGKAKETIKVLLLDGAAEGNGFGTVVAWYHAMLLLRHPDYLLRKDAVQSVVGGLSVKEMPGAVGEQELGRVLEEAGWDVSEANLDLFAPRVRVVESDKKEL